MIENYFSLPAFLSALATAEGKGKVRGYMFVQHLRTVTKTGKASYHVGDSIYANVDEGSVMKLVESTSEATAMALSANFDKTGFQKSSKWGVYGSALFIRDRPNQYFYLDIAGSLGAHAVALMHAVNCYGIFDPNFGVGVLPKEGRGSTRNFCTCLEHYIKSLYSGGLSNSHHITSFKSKARAIFLKSRLTLGM
ncbi:hypothetical protein GCM10023116_18790 [Kistimonas scapharcae]|uniref:Uncharacterized protein n=2 Tax=Kistimonas scapharcae TaxID=1036133 RepID=A0ABP8V0I4_9GAMM